MWAPGDPWPGTEGGAGRPGWSPYVQFYLQAEIAGGDPFRMGPDPADRLNDGNIMSRAGGLDTDDDVTSLWVDLACDCVDVEINLGSQTGAGILSQSEAGTLTATFSDPDGNLDPYNTQGP